MKMIIEFFEPLHMKLCALIATSAFLMGGYNWVSWGKLTASDWGTWVGAIGTVGALIGTIWLASSTERTRRHEAHARAIVAAASLMLRMSQVAGGVQFVIDTLNNDTEAGYGYDYKILSDAIDSAGTWVDAEILPLVVLPNAVAANLAASRTGLGLCLAVLQKSAVEVVTGTKISGRAEILMPYLLSIRESIAIAQRECYKLLNGDAPPIFKQHL